MNKVIINLFFLLIFISNVSYSERVKINISANVIERSCTISSSSSNFSVKLDTGDLRGKKIGMPFTETPFSISLESCPDNLSSAHIKFTGESDLVMNNLLANLNETDSGAKGIAIGLYDSNNSNINIQNNLNSITIDHNLQSNIFKFYAYYVKTSDKYSAGKIISIANFELTYD
ncbi:fimbrial protein [Providencia burhodogranariea]|uniref:Fimbrial subunit n=1 Tax=Providencia burhodogranariea DSM 19968 TaxID=1141662 RepID=K8W674_9GAMM|nr:fimbrial protein [Providencia burhodogranariea]EKT56049.1 fimbrial subunit [Providencia burhodogranariea DSM 19968]